MTKNSSTPLNVFTSFQAIIQAACQADIETIKGIVASGFDVNSRDEYGESLLSCVIGEMERIPAPMRYEIVRSLLALGADPNLLDPDCNGALTEAMLVMDTEMLGILLDAGARPNEVCGFFDGTTLYDWAEMDYCYEIWEVNRFPEAPTEADDASEQTWLQYLDRLAVKYDRRRPDHLILLRKHGALRSAELKQ